MLPRDVVLRTCAESDARAAEAEGLVEPVEWRGAPAFALPELAEAEDLLADGLRVLASENRLAVVVGPDPAARAAALAAALGSGVSSVVLDDAHRLGIDDVLSAVEDLPEDAVLALSLDNALPLAEVAGAVALDVAASGICPILRADAARPRTALDRARVEVAAGRWPSVVADDRSWVTVAVRTPDEALVRVAQLVGTSIPRAFGHAGAAVGVVTWDPDGPVGVDSVAAALAGSSPHTVVADLAGVGERRWPATVVLLPGVVTSTVTRAAVYAALRTGVDHVSLVHGFGAGGGALAQAIATTTDRPRRTRLAALLTDS